MLDLKQLKTTRNYSYLSFCYHLQSRNISDYIQNTYFRQKEYLLLPLLQDMEQSQNPCIEIGSLQQSLDTLCFDV